jgi:glutathione S-transferase
MLLVIGNRNYSTWSLRAWLALRMAELTFDEEVIPMGQPESRARMLEYSPAGAVPVLVSGRFHIWDSLAISEYAAELSPAAGLWPQEREIRAVARSMSAQMHDGYRALRWHLVMNLRRAAGPTPLPDDAQAAVDKEVVQVTHQWRECRERFGGAGDFLFGGFTLADAMYAPVVTRLDTYAVSVDADTRSYMDAVLSHPLMKEWRAAAVAEPWRIEHSER